jgi:NAD(P)-dependent dehydrogenase (short-subunit alcohol dehydrogenase family)
MTSVLQRFNLNGKVAAVIGGAGFLCSTLSKALAEAGVQVVVLDLPEAAPAHLREFGRSVEYLQCDVTSKSSLQRCREEIIARFSKVDILLNGAGANAPTSFFEISDKEIERILGVNLVGLFYSCQVFGESMVAQQGGSIINFASASSGPPLSKAFVYSVAKAGVVNLTQNLAREWAPFNVRVNALRPGFFPTEWSMKHFIDEQRKAKILSHTPMARFGQPDELIGAVLWLASDAATFVTGSVVAVDGGFTAMTI